MVERRLNYKSTLGFEHFLDRAIRRLDMKSGKVRYLFCKYAAVIDGTGRHLIGSQNAVCDGDAVVILTKGRRLVDDTRTVSVGDICVYHDSESFVFELDQRAVSKVSSSNNSNFTWSVKYSNSGT